MVLVLQTHCMLCDMQGIVGNKKQYGWINNICNIHGVGVTKSVLNIDTCQLWMWFGRTYWFLQNEKWLKWPRNWWTSLLYMFAILNLYLLIISGISIPLREQVYLGPRLQYLTVLPQHIRYYKVLQGIITWYVWICCEILTCIYTIKIGLISYEIYTMLKSVYLFINRSPECIMKN